jgi:hypothetical protein
MMNLECFCSFLFNFQQEEIKRETFDKNDSNHCVVSFFHTTFCFINASIMRFDDRTIAYGLVIATCLQLTDLSTSIIGFSFLQTEEALYM